MMLKSPRVFFSGFVGLLCLCAVGCGGSDDQPSSKSDAAASVDAATDVGVGASPDPRDAGVSGTPVREAGVGGTPDAREADAASSLSSPDATASVVDSAVPPATGTALAFAARNSGTNNNLNDVTWSAAASKFIVVGDRGTILSSPDSITWTTQTSNSTATLHGVAASPATIVVVGASSLAKVILTSTDGVTWTERTAPDIRTLYSVTWTGTKFVLVGSGGAFAASPDGSTWTAGQVTSGAQDFTAVGSNGSLVIALSRSAIYSSPDAMTWTSRTSGSSGNCGGVAWSPMVKLFVVACSDGYFASSDGIDWKAGSKSVFLNTQHVAWAPSASVFVGATGGNLTTSSDGMVFVTAPQKSLTFAGLNGVAASPSRVVAIGNSGSIISTP